MTSYRVSTIEQTTAKCYLFVKYFSKMLLAHLAPIIDIKTTVRAITCPKKLIINIIMPFVPATDFHEKPAFLLS